MRGYYTIQLMDLSDDNDEESKTNLTFFNLEKTFKVLLDPVAEDVCMNIMDRCIGILNRLGYHVVKYEDRDYVLLEKLTEDYAPETELNIIEKSIELEEGTYTSDDDEEDGDEDDDDENEESDESAQTNDAEEVDNSNADNVAEEHQSKGHGKVIIAILLIIAFIVWFVKN